MASTARAGCMNRKARFQQADCFMAIHLDPERQQRFAEWVLEADQAVGGAEIKNASCVDFCQESLDVCYSDPPTDDLVLSFVTDGEVKGFGADLGLGRFGFDHRKGAFLLFPQNHATEVVGEGPFVLTACCIHWDKWTNDCGRLAGREVSDFNVLHSQVNFDTTIAALMQLGWSDAKSGRSELFYLETVGSAILFRLLLLSGQLAGKERANLQQSPKGLSKASLRAALEYIHDYCAFGEVGSLAELAELCDLSRFQFCRRFTASTGLTPSDYLVRLRVEAARHRINHGDSIVAAAIGSGFSDQAHLTRHFKRVFSITPGKYRQELHGKHD